MKYMVFDFQACAVDKWMVLSFQTVRLPVPYDAETANSTMETVFCGRSLSGSLLVLCGP